MKPGIYTLESSWQRYSLRVIKHGHTYILRIKSCNNAEVHAVYDCDFPTYMHVKKLIIASHDVRDESYECLVHLLQALIKVCIDAFPLLDCVMIQDVVTNPLLQFLFTYYHLFMYGRTWYEINFGASIFEPTRYILDNLRQSLWQSPNCDYSSFISFFNEQKKYHGTSFYYDNIELINKELDTHKLYTAKWVIPRRNASKYEQVFLKKRRNSLRFLMDCLDASHLTIKKKYSKAKS